MKPAVILDDDPHWATNIARGLRVFGGVSTVYFRSIEAFLRHYNLKYGDKEGLKRVLGEYSAVVCDNNFEAQGHEEQMDGWIRGAVFLKGQLGPASLEIPKGERPLLISFSPSSEEVLRIHEDALWKKFGIVSFHKIWETEGVGLALRIAVETGDLLTRRSLIEGVLGLPFEGDDWQTPKCQFFFNLRYDFCEETLRNEGLTQVEGSAKPLEWDRLVEVLSERTGINKETFLQRIKQEAEKLKPKIEGGPSAKERMA